MSHRKAGVRGLQNQKLNRENFQKVGQDIQALQYDQMTKLMNNFKCNLEEFAAKHSVEIRKNSTFRSQFQLMCSQLGVDPLASNKGFWTQMLGFGDFYYEVSVQVAQVCISTREINGGFIGFDELKEQVQRLRGSKAQPISEYL
jgi:ESCRT-II complex subunit VPS22